MTMLVSFIAGSISSTFIFKGNKDGHILGYILFLIIFSIATFCIFKYFLLTPVEKDSKEIVKTCNEINRLEMIEHILKKDLKEQDNKSGE